MKPTVPFAVSTLALAISMLAAGSATAQSSDTEEPRYTLEEIVVTARRRDESLRDIPVVVNAVTAEAIKELNLLQFEDIESTVPGLSLSSEGVLSRASLRGITFQPESRTTATVEFYMNDALVESNFLFKSLFDIQQIEVLRGPQGTLRGRSAPSGAITVTTARPNLSAVEGYVSANATNRDGTNLQGAINVPLIADKLAVRIAAIIEEDDLGGVKSVNSNTDPELETKGGRISIRFEPTENIDATLFYQSLDVDQVFFQSVAGPGAGFNGPAIKSADRLAITDEPSRVYQDHEMLVGHINWRFGGHELSYVGSDSNKDDEDVQPLDRGNLLPDSEVYLVRPNENTWDTHELRLSSTEPLWGKFDYTVGAFYAKTEIISSLTQPADFLPGAFGFPFAAPDPTAYDPRYLLETKATLHEVRRETSYFANLTWHLSDRTELTIGGRQIHAENDGPVAVELGSALAALPPGLLGLPSCAAAGLGSTYPGTCDIPTPLLGVTPGPFQTLQFPSDDEDPFVYNVSLSHHVNDDLMVYASVGSAWRLGLDVSAELNNASNNPLLNELSVVDPEESRSFEVGFKSAWLDGRATLDVALFHQQFDGLITRTQAAPYLSDNGVAVPSVSTRSWTVNADAIVDGIDVQGSFAITPNWSFSGAMSYADGHIDDDEIPCRDSNFDGTPDLGDVTAASFPAGTVIALCKSDASVSRAPKWNANLQSEYSLGLSNNLETYIRGLLNYYPSNDRQNVDFTVDSYSLLNLYLGVRDATGAWDVSLVVKNALNTGEVLSRSFSEVQSPGAVQTNFGPSGYYATSYTAPREVGLSVRYNFGGG